MPVKTKRSGVKLRLDTLTPQDYEKLSKPFVPARPVFKNCLRAFLSGGLICVIGQGVQEAFMAIFGMTSKEAASPTVAVMILISVILTSFGVYDKMAQWAGAGTAVPVTGFANSMCSAALEHRAEGLVLGVGGNMFKLAGSVIVFGAVAAFVIGIIYAFLGLGGGH
ncbi:stage V sporulation protein AC [Paenibacillus sp. 19GGS1-52]|uniref:stage V sporulation protein AC n=1 Tax=Paenibacillus sp. 19GGS1-52 TaxID=2758563 RepID=UPI001EFB1CE9|nr:stage V sporulation protein AC [Paenibacillus sp. 19GGS1-52]ULO06153.1 stage V sporulation protein AC [Paenibacillus sp. 19GGS1-52]